MPAPSFSAAVRPFTCGLVGLCITAGCGWVVDADRFRDLQVAPPGLQALSLYEGSGGAVGAGRGEPLWLDARAYADSVMVRSEDPRVTLSAPVRTADGTGLSVLAWIAPFIDLAEGDERPVILWLEDGTRTTSVTLTVLGLDELELAGLVDPQTLADQYSDISTTAPVRFEGTQPARLVSTGSVRLMHNVSVAGLGATPGAGGFAPGAGPRSGGNGDAVARGCASGGGGAGAREAGQPASGGASGGEASSVPIEQAPLEQTVGSGGGRGGNSGEQTGTRGGAGAGSMYVDGAVVLWSDELDASGAPGEDAPGSGCGQDGRGAGGGGSAGLIWVRARQALMAGGTARVAGGAGGSGGQKSGGQGADGWLRIDAPEDDVPSALGANAMHPAFRGPAWRISDARVLAAADLSFTADPGLRLSITLDEVLLGEVQADAQGVGIVSAPRAPGLHRLCLQSATAPQPIGEEASACIRIAVLP